MSARKEQLLGAALDYFLEHGIANLSLRPLAARIGTSARLLIFHFQSKEGLIAEVLDELQTRIQASCVAVLDAPARPGIAPMQRFWKWATGRHTLPCLRLMYEVHFIALQKPRVYARHLEQSSRNWIELIEARLPRTLRGGTAATLCAAVFDGLLMELLGTGDLRRTTKALDQFTAMLVREHESRPPAAHPPPVRTRPVRGTSRPHQAARRSEPCARAEPSRS